MSEGSALAGGGVLVRMVELYLLGRNCACPNGIVLARKELCLPGKSRPTRLSLFNFRGVCEFSVRTFDPTQISLFYSRGVYKFSFRTFDPTLLLLFISRGVRNFSVHKFDPTLLPFFISRGVRNFSVHKFDPTRFPFFNSRGAPLPKMNLFLSRGAPPFSAKIPGSSTHHLKRLPRTAPGALNSIIVQMQPCRL